MKTPTPLERLSVMEAEIAAMKKRRIHRAELLKLIECVVVHLKVEAQKKKGGKS
jgi:hypothetical protein